MTRGTRNYEQVPDEVAVTDPLGTISWQRVVKRGGQVQHHHHRHEDPGNNKISRPDRRCPEGTWGHWVVWNIVFP